jgi:hypothetical protein
VRLVALAEQLERLPLVLRRDAVRPRTRRVAAFLERLDVPFSGPFSGGASGAGAWALAIPRELMIDALRTIPSASALILPRACM